MVIYLILNLINHKMYIGKSVKDDIISKRSRAYKHLHGSGSKLVFQAVQKYEIENFLVIILHKEDCSKEKLKELEKYYIKHFNTRAPNGYNLTDGGDGFSGKHTEESKKKISESGKIAQKINQNRPEVRDKKSKSLKISHSRPEVKAKIAKANKGRRHTEKEKEDNRLSHLGKKASKATKKKMSMSAKGNTNARGYIHTEDAKKQISKSMKIVMGRPEDKLRQSEHSKLLAHNRYHKNRGIINLNCKFCKEE